MSVSPPTLQILLPVKELSSLSVRAVMWCRDSMLPERADREAIAGLYIETSMDS